jgi:hypothetical protein
LQGNNVIAAWVNIAAYAIAGIIALFLFAVFIRIGRTVIALFSEGISDWLEDTLEAAPGIVKILMVIIGIFVIFLIIAFVLCLILYNFASLLTVSYWIVAKLAELVGAIAGFIPRK